MKLVSSKSIRASAVKSFNVVHARDAPSLTILPCKAGDGDDDDDGGDGGGDDDGYNGDGALSNYPSFQSW